MNNFSPLRRLPLRPALLAVTLMLLTGNTLAQVSSYGTDTRDADRARRHKKDAAEEAKSKEPEQFPNATRVAPTLQATEKGGKTLNEIIALYQAKQYPQAIEKAEALATKTTNAYERAFAYQLAATAASDAGDSAKATADFKKALDSNGLDNNQHYQVMYNLAVVQYQTKHPADALATLERLMTETKTQTPADLSLKAALLGDLNRPADAAALYQQQLAADPNDAKAIMNAAAAYQQANEFAKANALLASAEAKGLLTDPAQYRALYVGYINDSKPKEALAVIDAGIAKGLIQPSPDLAKAYSVIAQNAYAGGDAKTAIAMYQRAAPMAADGEASLNLAKVLLNENRVAEARQAAQQALQKGVKHTEEATKIAGKKGS